MGKQNWFQRLTGSAGGDSTGLIALGGGSGGFPRGAEYGEPKGSGPKRRKRGFRFEVHAFSAEELEKTYRHSGLIWKGVNRKARDALKKGFRLKPDDEDPDDERELNRIVQEWMRNTGYIPKSIKALKEMYVFGDGFLELGFSNDRNDADESPPGGPPSAVWTIDPLAMRPVKDPETNEIVAFFNGERVRQIPDAQVEHWVSGGPLPEQVEYVIHPDRIQHFQVNTLREDKVNAYGISIIEAAYLNALSKLAGDSAAGDLLEWYGTGFFVLNIDFGTPEEIRKALKTLEEAKAARRNYFAASERSKFDIKTPTLGDWRPFYEGFYIEIAAALEMPVMMLTGVQKGTVTGSGTDAMEYYDDVMAFQDQHLGAFMYAMLRRVTSREDFTIRWTPLFVNKQTEADIRFKDSQSAAVLANAKLLTKRQAVHYLRTGELPMPDDVPDDYLEDGQGASPRSDDPGAGDPDSGEEAPPAPEARRRDRGRPLVDTETDFLDPEDEEDEDEWPDDGTNWFNDLHALTKQDRERIRRHRELGKRILEEGGAE